MLIKDVFKFTRAKPQWSFLYSWDHSFFPYLPVQTWISEAAGSPKPSRGGQRTHWLLSGQPGKAAGQNWASAERKWKAFQQLEWRGEEVSSQVDSQVTSEKLSSREQKFLCICEVFWVKSPTAHVAVDLLPLTKEQLILKMGIKAGFILSIRKKPQTPQNLWNSLHFL